jgi:hypothetical protein
VAETVQVARTVAETPKVVVAVVPNALLGLNPRKPSVTAQSASRTALLNVIAVFPKSGSVLKSDRSYQISAAPRQTLWFEPIALWAYRRVNLKLL